MSAGVPTTHRAQHHRLEPGVSRPRENPFLNPSRKRLPLMPRGQLPPEEWVRVCFRRPRCPPGAGRGALWGSWLAARTCACWRRCLQPAAPPISSEAGPRVVPRMGRLSGAGDPQGAVPARCLLCFPPAPGWPSCGERKLGPGRLTPPRRAGETEAGVGAARLCPPFMPGTLHCPPAPVPS